MYNLTTEHHVVAVLVLKHILKLCVLVPTEMYRDIPWDNWGICRQMTGNHQAAMYPNQQSPRQPPLHKIQNTTRNQVQD